MSLDERRFPTIVPDHTNKEMPASLSDERIDDFTRAHGTGGWQTMSDMRSFARAVIEADRYLHRGDVATPELPKPSLPTHFMGPHFTADQMHEYAQAALAAKDAEITALKAERDALKVAAKYAEHIDATPKNQLQTMLYDTLTERDALRKDAERYRNRGVL